MYFPIKKKEELTFEWEHDERKYTRKKTNKNFKRRQEGIPEHEKVNKLESLPQNNVDNVLNDENNVEYEWYHESENETTSEYEDEKRIKKYMIKK